MRDDADDVLIVGAVDAKVGAAEALRAEAAETAERRHFLRRFEGEEVVKKPRQQRRRQRQRLQRRRRSWRGKRVEADAPPMGDAVVVVEDVVDVAVGE